jgi:hypothetical protein
MNTTTIIFTMDASYHLLFVWASHLQKRVGHPFCISYHFIRYCEMI